MYSIVYLDIFTVNNVINTFADIVYILCDTKCLIITTYKIPTVYTSF